MTFDHLHFTPLASLLGGVLIGAAAALLVLAQSRIAGVSGIVGGLLPPRRGDAGWRIAFVAGLLMAPLAWSLVAPLPDLTVDAGWPTLVVSGLLAGLGTRFAGGCTSGHGVCGLSRLSPRSMAATAVFMASAFATAHAWRHIL